MRGKIWLFPHYNAERRGKREVNTKKGPYALINRKLYIQSYVKYVRRCCCQQKGVYLLKCMQIYFFSCVLKRNLDMQNFYIWLLLVQISFMFKISFEKASKHKDAPFYIWIGIHFFYWVIFLWAFLGCNGFCS